MTVVGDKAPQINVVTLIRKTLGKVFEAAGFPETPEMIRTILTCMIRVSAEYSNHLGDDPEHIQALFKAFLTGTEEEQRLAIAAFGAAFLPKPEAAVTDEVD